MTKSPSQTSTKELDKQIAAKQQQLQTLTTATNQAQAQWQSKQQQIADDTKVTITAAKDGIASELKDGRKELSSLLDKIERAKDKLANLDQAHSVDTKTFAVEIADLERDKKILQTTHTSLAKQNLELESKITVSKEAISELRDQEANLAEKLVDMRMDEQQLVESLDTLNGQVAAKTTELDALNIQLNTTKDEKQRELGVLEAKRDAVAQEIIENRQQDLQVRDNLADWQKKLEKKEENLKVREAQVNLQQQAISRNANLLQL